MKTISVKQVVRRTIIMAGAVLLMMTSLAACGVAPNDATSSSTQTNSASNTAPQPVLTEDVFPTFTPAPISYNSFSPHSLVNASADEVAQATINNLAELRIIYSVKPTVLLVRPTTWNEIAGYGWGTHSSSTVEEPPLMLVVMKGSFATSVMGGLIDSTKMRPATYLACVIDLWAGVPTMFFYGEHGEGFATVLNDPSLPPLSTANAPVNSEEYRPHPVPTAPIHLHYGDVAPGLPSSGQLVRQASFGAWRYEARRGVTQELTPEGASVGADKVFAVVSYEGSVTAQYLEANRQLLQQKAAGSGTVEVWVAFRDYQPVAQFRTFGQAHKLQTGVSYLRVIDTNPKPVYSPYYTLQVNASGADAIPQAQLDSKFAAISNDPQKQMTLKGVYLTHAWVDAKELTAFAADPNVYYVDMTAAAVRDDLAKNGIAGVEQAVIVPHPELVFNSMVEAPMENK